MAGIMRCAMTIAGSDSIGGAGVQADIKAMASVGIHACSAITAITAQNTTKVAEIYPVPLDMIQGQIEAIMKDVDIKAIKTGMLYSEDIVELVADLLEDHEMPLIVDPVMVAGVGDSLAEDGLAKAIKKNLVPICELVTPNKQEAEILAKMKIRSADDARLACELIGKEGSSVLLKGGHFEGKNVIDYFYLSSEIQEMVYPRLERAGHGGGCTLSSYITAHMAKGMSIFDAVYASRKLIQESIATMYAIGHGDKCVNPVAKMHDDSVRFAVLDSLDATADKLVNMIPKEWVPPTGMNIAFALPNAAGAEDIAAIDKKLVFHNGAIHKGGKAKYGSAEHASFMLLSMMKFQPDVRATINFAYNRELTEVIEEVGLDIYEFDRKKYSEARLGEITTQTIKDIGRIPDAFIDTGKSKKEAVIRLVGKTPEDLISKIEMFI